MHFFKKGILAATCCLITVFARAEDFASLLRDVEKHPNVEATKQSFIKRSTSAQAMSSLKDPNIKVSALNLPISTMSFDQTPMSSKQVAIMQSLPLTTRLIHLEDQAEYLQAAGKNQTQFQIAKNRALLWTVAAKIESLDEQLRIVRASLDWIKQVDKSTQRLYSTGKINQISLLEIKVRKSELESQNEDLKFQLSQAQSQVGFLTGRAIPVSPENVPWGVLDSRTNKNSIDQFEMALKKEVLAAQSNLRAQQLSYVPDLTFGAAYSFRENIDGQGDFVSGFVQFSLPLWGETNNKKNASKAEANEKAATLQKYKLIKQKQIQSLNKKILAREKELELITKSIEFALTEQKLATKRYSLGQMSIFELLEIELKYRSKKSKKEALTEDLRSTRIELLLLKGDPLHV